MKTLCRFFLMLVGGALVFQGGSIALAQGSWVGEKIQITKPTNEIKFGDVVQGKQVYFPLNDRADFKVLTDREGWLRFHDGHREGWADKADFVLVRDAPAYFHRRVQANPNDTFALYHRGVGWMLKGEPDIAIKDFDECIRLEPSDKVNYNVRGNAWLAKKDYDKAIRDYGESIRLDPSYALPYFNRGLAWANKKAYDKAIRDYDEAIRLDPKYVDAFFNRGIAWSDKKAYDKAIRDYDVAIRLDPKNADILNSRAWLWATCPDAKYRDGKRAVESAKKAVELEKNANNMDTLAAAYAEAGDFDQAVRWQEQALQNNNDEGYRQRLELYRKKTPYRQD